MSIRAYFGFFGFLEGRKEACQVLTMEVACLLALLGDGTRKVSVCERDREPGSTRAGDSRGM